MRFATLLTLLAVAEAQTKYKCDNKDKITCSAPKSDADLEACECVCPATNCEEWQTLGDDCVCADNPCDACPLGEGGATEADFDQGAQPECACTAADGEDPCDAKYGGLFTEGLDGAACPAGDDGAAAGGDEDMMESGAAQLLAGTMVLAASLLI